MKLCMVLSSMGSGGAERVAANLANHWAAQGWDITIITFAGKADFYPLHPSISRIRLPNPGVSKNTIYALQNNLRRLLNLRRTLLRVRPGVTLSLMPTANVLCALATIGTMLKTVGSEHNHPPERQIPGLWNWLRKRTYRRHQFVSALTEKTAQWLEQNTSARRIEVIPNPINYPLPSSEPRIPPGTLKGESGHKLTLLAVGRLVKEKGFDRLICVFCSLASDFPDWQLVILGEGELRSQLETQAAESEHSNQIHMPGTVGNVGDWYQQADLFVMSSRTEGFGNTLAEALSYGLPAVAMDCETGPRDILRDGVDGRLVADGDLVELENALRELMSDGDLRSQLSVNTLEARTRFSVELIARKWEELLALDPT